MKYNKTIKNKKLLLLTILIYLSFIIPYTISVIKKNSCDIKSGDRLQWNWANDKITRMIYLLFSIVIGILGHYGLPKYNKLFPVISVVSYLISSYIYGQEHVGTMWCYFGALLPTIFLLLN